MAAPPTSSAPPGTVAWRFGLWMLDLRQHTLCRDGIRVPLAPLPFRALALLSENAPALVTRAELIQALWPGERGDCNERLDFVLSKLRKALRDNHANPVLIRTQRGVGFALIPEVVRVAPVTQTPPPPDPAPPPPAAAPPCRLHRWGPATLALSLAAMGIAGLIVALFGDARAPVPPLLRGPWTAVTRGNHQLGDILVARSPWLYGSEFQDGNWVTVRILESGGAIQPLTPPGLDTRLLDVSPNGATVIVARGGFSDPGRTDAPLWLLDPQSGGMRPLGRLSGHAVAWRPDGGALLVANAGQILLATPRGDVLQTLPKPPGIAAGLAWSPDGRHIRFAILASANQPFRVWETAADGTNPRRIPTPPAAAGAAEQVWPHRQWSFLVTYGEGSSTLWLLPHALLRPWFAPSRPASAVATDLSGPRLPAVDAARRRLFLIGIAADDRMQLLRLDLHGGRLEPVGDAPSADALDYSPDGARVAYAESPLGALWIARADFSQPRRVATPAGEVADFPRWSPDGRWIAFIAQAPSQPWSLYMVSAQGGSPQLLLAGDPTRGIGAPTWTPDSRGLYFGNVNCANETTCGIGRFDLLSRTATLLPGTTGLRTARLSPSGRYLAAIRSASHRIAIEDLRTGVWRDSAQLGIGDVLAWSHDSQVLYAMNPGGDHPALFRIHWPDGGISPVADLSPLPQRAGVVGSWFGLATDGTPLLSGWGPSLEIYSMPFNPN